MADAPEQIWAKRYDGVRDSGVWSSADGVIDGPEYIHADLVTTLEQDAYASGFSEGQIAAAELGLLEIVAAPATPPAAVVEAMEQALRFYDKSWNATPNKRYGGLEWKPREALLDDCGNCAKSALADLDKWRAGK